MLFVLLFIFSQAKKRICICYKHCHYTCPIDSFVATNSESQFKDYLITQIKDEKEIELDFYSTQTEFTFYIDLSLFGDVKIALTVLNDSQPIKLNIKDKSQPINHIIEINPNFQINFPDLTPFQIPHIDQGKNTLLDTSNIYINEFFNETLPESQIIVSESSSIDQITGCTFYRISENFDYFISLYKPIPISENIFEYTNDQTNAPSPIEVHFNDHITINRCVFINSISRVKLGNVFYSSSDYEITANFESCEFINCGKYTDEMIIKIDNVYSTVNINNCTFKFDDSQNSSKIIDASISNIHITECNFFQCGEMNIEIKSEEGVFEYRNNIASFFTQQLLNISNIRVQPIFSNNVFQNNFLYNTYFIRIMHNLDQISLDNNTFSNCSSRSNTYGGSIALLIQKLDFSQGEIIFNQCKFYDNENHHTSGFYAHGGALQIGYIQSAANVSVEFNDCEFKRNKSRYGGALGISIAHNLTLSNCIFENNTTIQKGGAVYICGTIKSEEQDAPNLPNSIEMESIYIVDCIFNENKASTCAAIFAQEYDFGFDLLKIEYCKFTNNVGDNNNKQVMIESTNKRFSFENNVVEYTQSKSIHAIEIKVRESIVLFDSTFTNCIASDSPSISFYASKSSIPSLDMSNCTFIDCEMVGFASIGTVTINDCSFVFINSQRVCTELYIKSPSLVSISNCIFNNTGGIIIQENEYAADRIYLENITFDSCTKSSYSAIYIKSYCTKIDPITNINISNIQNTNIFGFNTPKADLTFENCTFSNCSSNNENGGGIGSYLLPKDKILFDNCNFFDNYCDNNGGAFQYRSNDKALEFQNCNFIRNKTPKNGGALSIQTQQNLKISGCVFLQNKAGYSEESSLLNEYLLGWGGALYINPNIQEESSFIPEITIQSNTFVENSGVDGHGAYIIDSKNTNVIFEEINVFTDNGQTGSCIISDQNITLINTVFNSTNVNAPISNQIRYVNDPAIYEDITFKQQVIVERNQNISYFHNCTFDNCNFEEKESHQYVITILCYMFTFINCTVKFNSYDHAIGAIYIDRFCNITISDCYFARCNVSDYSQSAGIYYDPTEGNDTIENMVFTNNTFDEMGGVNARCFRIAIEFGKIGPIHDIIIKNCPEDGYTGAFYFKDSGSYTACLYSFYDWKFINNRAKSLLKGGCGLWISPRSYTGKDVQLSFTNCEWNGNTAVYDPTINTMNPDGNERPALHSGAGGAFQTGFTESNVNTQLSFSNCQFIGNHAQKEGGALAIQTTRNCDIRDCTFNGNTAVGKGGALFIDPDFDNPFVTSARNPEIIIQNCQFLNNEGEDGSAFYITGNQAIYKINDITFTDNKGSNSVFYSTTKTITFTSSRFTSISSSNVRAIEFAALVTIRISNISFIDFSNANRQVNGGAIKISNNANTASSNLLAEEANYEILFCTFRGCKTQNKGGAIYATNINKIEVRSCIFDDCYGDGSIVYSESTVNEFKLYYNEIMNINDPNHNIFVCCANKFNIDEQNIINPGNVQGPLFQSDTIRIDGITFEGLKTGITIGENIKDASITNCKFINCQSNNDFVIQIMNNKAIFEYNTISFDQNLEIKGRAININGHGSIKVNHNQFLYCCPSSHDRPSINIVPIGEGEKPIEFNYNFIQGISNKKFCIFNLDLSKQDITFNHNKIYKCINTGNGDDSLFSKISNIKSEFTFENLIFEECSSKTSYGGNFGCWFTALNYEDPPNNLRISYINCSFINNNHQGDSSNGGGAFQLGHSSNAYFYIDVIGCKFEGNSALREGGALSLGGIRSSDSKNKPITICDCIFNNNIAKFGVAIFIYNDYIESSIIENYETHTNETYNEIEITNCKFIHNKSNRHGGSCFFKNINNISINECLFDGNIANKQYSSSSQLLVEKAGGSGGALFISSSYDIFDTNDTVYLIEKCTFINNNGNDGNSIYIEGFGTGSEFIIRQNNFTNNFRSENENNDPYFIYRAVITSEVFNLYDGKVLTENIITNYDAVQKVKLSYVNHNGIPAIPTKTTQFSMSNYFTESKLFSESNSFSSLATPFVHTKMPIYSNSFSLTYVLQKSISFSISYYSSNTYSISFNAEENTYVFVSSEMNLYSYFPYLIRFLSPSYVATYISINKKLKKGISQEQLIGLTCGSASVFFLILGIIILIVRHRRERDQIYDEFDDISYSSEEVTIQQAANKKDNMENIENMNDNSYDTGNQGFFI